ncbi:right-handed parallel beta-helix repeat-containing protein [Sneathiella sp. HT1-7]|uniref:right-handed parallel beta-helix repeat-containing protein n=1 Tax=Sneathiella sp. HT1-7 TaxID=2887192 RepID=UPI001D137C38|nr:right-handed parallel beta-helix repeat-containing protein [Sneathiella sp. HT1-7]MCC3303883.1 right-handed parallel beta-helix repeat-containing protein [Sneathiella sp. HT1-7]
MTSRHLIFSFMAMACVWTTPAIAQDLFVDFEKGKDSNSGITKSAPWQHAPGDANAASNAGSYKLRPGDVVNFKGGVEYLGSIAIPAGGSDSQPITYKGNGWGEGRAILSGAKELKATFTPCASASDCHNNPNWEKLFKSSLEEDVNPFTPMFLSDRRVWIAREPNQPDPFWFDDYEHYNVVGGDVNRSVMGADYLTLDNGLDNTDEKNWQNARIAVWMKPNLVLLTEVTGIDTASNTIKFNPPGNDPYTDRESYYALFNRPSDVDQPGEYFIDNEARRIVIWPENPETMENSRLYINELAAGFNINGSSNLVIEGFHIRHYFGDHDGWASGTAIINSDHPVRNVVIRDNYIDHLRSVEGIGAIQLHKAQDVVVSNNTVTNSQKSSGIRFGFSKDIIIRDNVIHKIGRTGIRLIETENIQVTGNTLSDILGVHGNGMSVYLKNKAILVAENMFDNVPFAFTYHGTGNIEEANSMWLLSNIFLGRVRSWGSQFGSMHFLHNMILAEVEPGKSIQIPGHEPSTVFKNNIIDGLIVSPAPEDWVFSHNIYSGLSWLQSSKYGWTLEPGGDIDEGITDEIWGFFSEKQANVARGQGDNIYKLLPVARFKAYDFSHWKEARAIGPRAIPSP